MSARSPTALDRSARCAASAPESQFVADVVQEKRSTCTTIAPSPLIGDVAVKALIAAVLGLTVLAGCAVHTRDGSLIVDPNGVSGGSGFCPPGQAKKGRC